MKETLLIAVFSYFLIFQEIFGGGFVTNSSISVKNVFEMRDKAAS